MHINIIYFFKFHFLIKLIIKLIYSFDIYLFLLYNLNKNYLKK